MNTRLSNFKKILISKSLDAALISSLSDIIYLTDFSHFTNVEREGFLLITQNHNYIITDGRYSHAVKSYLKDFTLLETSPANPFEKLLKEIIGKEKINTLGIDEDNITVSEHKKITSQGLLLKHIDLSKLRIIKDSKEISMIKKACQIGDKTYSGILKNLRIGITERQVAFEIELFIKKRGADISFPPIVAFEENSAIPHHKTSDKRLKTNDLILMDFGVKYKNYCSDMTRTVCFGKANDEKRKVYETVIAAQQRAIETLNSKLLTLNSVFKPIPTSLIDQAARSYITSKCFDTIPHSLGHGIGLEVHETPRLSPKSLDQLENGMVFSIEPGIYFPDKFGIRIEDLFTIQNNKLIQLTTSPTRLLEI